VRQWQVCDAGCGTGFLETLLSDRVGSIVAFDASMLERARQKFPSRPIAWVQADAQALPVHAPVFDLVCSNAMLYHVFGFERVLAAMIALLKPGGCLFLGYEPNAIAYRLLGPLLKVAPTIVPEHRNRERIREAGPGRLSELRERRHQRAART
jgi:ubiquinone/menaquinone biosynthesis C-methylase UbiE